MQISRHKNVAFINNSNELICIEVYVESSPTIFFISNLLLLNHNPLIGKLHNAISLRNQEYYGQFVYESFILFYKNKFQFSIETYVKSRRLVLASSPLFTCIVAKYIIYLNTVFRLLTDFVCLYNYEFWLSLCKIVRNSLILLLPLISVNKHQIWF
jgi:hypothetical protein